MEGSLKAEDLCYKKTSAWKTYGDDAMEYAVGYMNYIGENKTERECTAATILEAEKKGFKSLNKAVKNNEKLKAGNKYYLNHMNKCVMLFVIGKKPLCEGMNITAAHIDSPRLDLKSVPLYEDGGIAMFKTHYYGGIKKYQWTAVPLAMHGVIYCRDGSMVNISYGENPQDPVFFISDLLVHLSADQLEKTAAKAVTAEQLNIIVGNMPLEGSDDVKDSVKLNVLRILNEAYNITEEDFLSAEIEFIPAVKPRSVGFDSSMIAAYAHDDKVCAYPAYTAILEVKDPEATCACILADKEEIGSVGSTGLNAMYFENAVAELCALEGNVNSELTLRRCLSNSSVLSMDVSCAFDPSFSDAFEKQNTAILGSGTVLTKYTGSRGKSSSNDANAEYMQKIRKLFNDNNVPFQTGELGKADQGGGGTVAYILAKYGADTVDLGVGVLSMHAPCELISKADLYSTYKAAEAFYKMN